MQESKQHGLVQITVSKILDQTHTYAIIRILIWNLVKQNPDWHQTLHKLSLLFCVIYICVWFQIFGSKYKYCSPRKGNFHLLEKGLCFSAQNSWRSFKPITCVFLYDIHAIPFYKKRSYKERPIKFFNHKKQQPIEFPIIRNNFFYWQQVLLLKHFVYFKKMPKGW